MAFNKVKILALARTKNDLSKGIYNGTVVDNADPGTENGGPVGRIRVEIDGLTKGIEVDDLPWYIGRHPISNSPNANFKVPPVGSQVIVEFPTNDIYNGIYSYVIVSQPPKISK